MATAPSRKWTDKFKRTFSKDRSEHQDTLTDQDAALTALEEQQMAAAMEASMRLQESGAQPSAYGGLPPAEIPSYPGATTLYSMGEAEALRVALALSAAEAQLPSFPEREHTASSSVDAAPAASAEAAPGPSSLAAQVKSEAGPSSSAAGDDFPDWQEPDTSSDELLARALAEQERASLPSQHTPAHVPHEHGAQPMPPPCLPNPGYPAGQAAVQVPYPGQQPAPVFGGFNPQQQRHPPWSSAWHVVPPPAQPKSDAEVAWDLQREFSMEAKGILNGPAPGPVQLPTGAPAAAPPAVEQSSPSAPPAAAGPRTPDRSPSKPSATSAAAPKAPYDPSYCGGCGKPMRSWQLNGHVVAMGKRWHPWCLKCAECQEPIQSGGGAFAIGEDSKPYHVACHKAAFHPRCDVCSDFLAQQEDGYVRFHKVPFWGQRYCPAHDSDATPRCFACNRLQPNGEQWVGLEDGRHTCLACLDTMVMNTADCQGLYSEILKFYEGLSMKLPVRPPLMLVESGALNEAGGREGRAPADGPVFHTRGLTLSEEHRSIRSVMGTHRGTGGGTGRGSFLNILPEFTSVPVMRTRHEVTAILVLYGLPRLLTGSILAHEVMHAYLRLSGCQHLSMDVEEGLAQLMALLWLEAQDASLEKGTYQERLASYLANQIRTDPTPVYGDGFRAAHENFQRVGLPAMLDHVRTHGCFPV